MEEENKEKTELKSFFNNNKTTILGVIILALIVGYGIYAKNNGKLPLANPSSKTITLDEAKAKVEQFIKDNGGQATVKDATEEGGLYKIMVNVNNQDVPTYVTKDGTKFFPQAIDFAEAQKQAEDAKKQQAEADKPAPKTDKPAVDLYVMAFCPYGNKAEDTLKTVYNLLKNKVDFNFHYIITVDGNNITSLHGQKEVDQDEREACVLKNYGKDQWINFATYINDKCGSDGSCWEAGAKSLGIDTAKISACVSSQGPALMKANADASNAAKATGSPTLIINGQNSQAVYKYGDSEAYKKAICDAFNTAPAECSKALSTQTQTTQGGSCGS